MERLKLSGILATLPDRAAYATKTKLALPDFLELVLQDEIDRREHKNLALRLAKASFEQEQTLESFDWDAPITFDRDRVRDLFGLGFLERREDVLLLGPVGVGKTFLASALDNLGHEIGLKTIKAILVDNALEPPPERGKKTSWETFVKSHWGTIVATDFFSVEVLTPRRRYGLIVRHAGESL